MPTSPASSASDAVAVPHAASCPDCGGALTDDPRFIRWCQACEWNAHPGATGATEARSRGDRFQRRFNRATEERLFRRVTEGGSRPRTLDKVSVAAYAFAGLVHLAAVAVAGYAVYALTLPYLAMRCLGVLLLVISYFARPRFGPSRKALKRMPLVDRGAAPALYALTDRVARELGTTPPALIAVVDGYTASYSRIGLRRRVLLRLGLPLWESLTPEQRVALLGHELGHGVNGDSRRGLWVGTALGELAQWYSILQPGRDRLIHSGRASANTLLAFGDRVANWLLAGFAEVVLLAHRLLRRLTALSGRRAEYLADALAVRTGGTDATAGLLQALTLVSSFAHFNERYQRRARQAARQARSGAADRPAQLDYWDELRAYVSSVPQSERARRLLVSRLDDSVVDSTHPPTHLRLAYVEQLPAAGPAVVLSAAEAAAIEAELAPMRTAFVRDLP
ncbi:M48 family metalloprotease [Streptacidiphilus sp. 4-A2]|nr:M48 family metalloprotease [Streptacidiphilus sp. 4-A2]